MRGTIVEIKPRRLGKNFDVVYLRIRVALEDGTHAMTDLCPDFRNFTRWNSPAALAIGDTFDGFVLFKDDQGAPTDKIDADSFVTKLPPDTPPCRYIPKSKVPPNQLDLFS